MMTDMVSEDVGNRTSHDVAIGLLIALFLPIAASFCMVLHSIEPAYAYVQKADIICGQTVEDRGLSVAECPSIEATRAYLIAKDGTVYFERNDHEPAQIASITKVMTAIVAIENAAPNTYVAVSADAAYVGESSAGLQEGDVMDMESALKALLVPSGNDAAVAIAETVGGQMIAADPDLGTNAMEAFVSAMNKKAEELGCTDTLYENPHGLDDDGWEGELHSTAEDQGIVARYAMSFELFRKIVGGGSTTIVVTRNGSAEAISLETTDLLFDMYDYAIGIKTGVTNLAGPSFMGAASMDGIELYSVVLDSTSEWDRFQDTKTLFTWAYDHMVTVKLAHSDETASMTKNDQIVTVPIVARVSHGDWLDRTVAATFEDPNADVSVFDLEGNITQEFTFDDLHGTIRAGQKIGSVAFMQRGRVVATQNLIAAENVGAPDLFEGIAVWWNRFIGGFTGASERADSQVFNVMPIINNKVSVTA